MLTVLATRAGTSLPTLLFWRYALGALGLFAVARARAGAGGGRAGADGPGGAALGAAGVARLVLLGGAGQAAVAGLSLSSLRWVSAATLGFLFYTFPAWVLLFAAARGAERVDARRAAAVALSLAGVALMVGTPRGGAGGGGGAPAWPGVALALTSAVAYALYIPVLNRISVAAGAVRGSAYVTAGAAGAFFLWAVVERTFDARLPALSWAVALALAFLCTVLAFAAFLSGLRVLGPVRTAIVSTVEPFWTAVLGAALLGQPVTASAVGGGALIAAAVLLIQLPPKSATANP